MVYVHCKFKRFVWTTLKEYVFLLQDVTFNIQYSGEPFLLIEGDSSENRLKITL